MRKYTLDELKSMDTTKIMPKRLVTTMTYENCEDEKDLKRFKSQVKKFIEKQTYPILLKMNSTTGKTDYEIVRCPSEVIDYCGDYLDCKNGYDVYVDENDEPLIVVYGQICSDKEKENVMHWSYQCVKMINMNNLDVDKTEFYKYLLEKKGY